jgi:hypothetical protein
VLREIAMRLHKSAQARISSGDIPVILEETMHPSLSQRRRECASPVGAHESGVEAARPDQQPGTEPFGPAKPPADQGEIVDVLVRWRLAAGAEWIRTFGSCKAYPADVYRRGRREA